MSAGQPVTLAGRPEELFGDRATEFKEDDTLVVADTVVTPEMFDWYLSSAVLTFDLDLDGQVDGEITLEGDYFEGAVFSLEIIDNDTHITVDLNQAPVALNDRGVGFTTDDSASFRTGSVLVNDSDFDGDTLAVSGLDATGTLGLVTNNGDGTFNYDPNGAFDALAEGETATDAFAYFVTDGVETVRGEVTITINGEDYDAPDVNLIDGTPGRDILRGTAEADQFVFKGGIGDVAVGNGGDDIFDFTDNVANGAVDNTRIVDWADGDMIFGFGFDDIDLGTVRSSSHGLRFAYGPDHDLLTVTGDVSAGLSSLFDTGVA
jgi:VCBS repeat-containing protein